MIDLTAIKFYSPGDSTPCYWTVYRLEREKESGVLYWGIVKDYFGFTENEDKEFVLKDYPNAIELDQNLRESYMFGKWDDQFRRKYVIRFEDSHLQIRSEA